MYSFSGISFEDKFKICVLLCICAHACYLLISMRQRKLGRMMQSIQKDKDINATNIPSALWRKRARDDYYIYKEFSESGLDREYPDLTNRYKQNEVLVLVIQNGVFICCIIIILFDV